jgi:stearoyl-CoA desaturase (Delta-9 desaturase)
MIELSWLELLLLGLCTTQIVIFLVTVYFHRAVSHRSVILTPIMHKICRFLSWFMIAMDPQEFAAVHRKHHAKVDTKDDPHSPIHKGLLNVLFFGLPLYRKEAKNIETIKNYGHGMWPDSMENFYKKNQNLGIIIFGILLISLFGFKGALLWAAHLVWIPFWAAGVINGLGHHFGYRNFSTADSSTNLTPWGIWVGGEELHNNHHYDPSRPKFSIKPYEIDIGWGWIKTLEFFKLLSVKPVGKWQTRENKQIDEDLISNLLQQKIYWNTELQKAITKDLISHTKISKGIKWHKIKDFYARFKVNHPIIEQIEYYEISFINWVNKKHHSMEDAIQEFKHILENIQQFSIEKEFKNIGHWCDNMLSVKYVKLH